MRIEVRIMHLADQTDAHASDFLHATTEQEMGDIVMAFAAWAKSIPEEELKAQVAIRFRTAVGDE